MLEALTFEHMIEKLKNRSDDIKNIGILFCNPNNKFAKEQVLDKIEQFYYGSSKYIDFYLPGYGAYWNDTYKDKEVVCKVNGVEWYYSEKEYRGFINKLEEICKWEYSGECEVLFFEYIDGNINFENSISIWLDKSVKDNDIYSVANEFEKIFRLCKSGKNLTEISNIICMKSMINTGGGILIEKTGGLGKLYKNSKYAVTRNLNK